MYIDNICIMKYGIVGKFSKKYGTITNYATSDHHCLQKSAWLKTIQVNSYTIVY